MVKAATKRNASPDVELAFDIETRGFSDSVICVCAVSNYGDVIKALSFDQFVKRLRALGLTRRKRGEVRLWAHYGGSFDVLVGLKWFLSNGWQIENGKAGAMGSLWAVDLVRGRERIELRDSARLFSDSVRKLGDAFGLAKLDVDRGNLQELPIDEVLRYCVRDCEIVLKAVLEFQKFVESEQGWLADTIAGCASRIVRARCVPGDAFGWTPDTDEIGAAAYYGGRVERFRRESAGGNVFDVNSMYPWAMTHALPARYLGTGTGKPPRDGACVVRARVYVPRGTFVGPLPHRPTEGALRGRLVFPTGVFTGTWTLHELETAERCTPGLWWHPLRWHQWSTEPWLADLIAGWYARRLQAKSDTERYLLKILLNSVSGKLIERAEYESLTSISAVARQAESDGNKVVLYPTNAGVFWGIREMRVGALRHGAAAAYVLSMARGRLLETMCEFSRLGRLDYCDTDSVFGEGLPRDVDEKRLGAWKNESHYTGATFLAPKLYALETQKGLTVKCKGWPKTIKDANGDERKLEPRELWATILAGDPVSSERTTLIKTQIRTGKIGFARAAITRQRRGGIDKRCFSSDELSSRPWEIDELPHLRRNDNGKTTKD